MDVKYFVDSNILLYVIDNDALRTPISVRLASRSFCISVQVLNEFAHVATRKLKLSPTEIRDVLTPIRFNGELFPLTEETHELAWKIFTTTNFGIYDCNIIAAAELAGCDVLYTEDMNHGQRVGRVTIQNPFVEA